MHIHTHTHTLQKNTRAFSAAAVRPNPLIPVDGGYVCSDICFFQCGPVVNSSSQSYSGFCVNSEAEARSVFMALAFHWKLQENQFNKPS